MSETGAQHAGDLPKGISNIECLILFIFFCFFKKAMASVERRDVDIADSTTD